MVRTNRRGEFLKGCERPNLPTRVDRDGDISRTLKKWSRAVKVLEAASSGCGSATDSDSGVSRQKLPQTISGGIFARSERLQTVILLKRRSSKRSADRLVVTHDSKCHIYKRSTTLIEKLPSARGLPGFVHKLRATYYYTLGRLVLTRDQLQVVSVNHFRIRHMPKDAANIGRFPTGNLS